MSAAARFPTTRWTLILEAVSPEARRTALGELCAAYWPPAYAFIRRQVRDPEEAKDLTQAFFLRLLEKRDLPHQHLARARFRSFLLVSIKHFLSNEWDRSRAQKRGGGRIPFSIEVDDENFWREPVDTLTPEKIFEKHWATMMLDRTLRSLRGEFEASGKGRQFEVLKGCLVGDRCLPAYSEIGARLEMTEGAIKMAVHRMRGRFREILRDEIAQTVSDAAEIDDELHYLISAMSS
jgi:RNA polymerase sigma-70 factor (ECF subfamily)